MGPPDDIVTPLRNGNNYLSSLPTYPGGSQILATIAERPTGACLRLRVQQNRKVAATPPSRVLGYWGSDLVRSHSPVFSERISEAPCYNHVLG